MEILWSKKRWKRIIGTERYVYEILYNKLIFSIVDMFLCKLIARVVYKYNTDIKEVKLSESNGVLIDRLVNIENKSIDDFFKEYTDTSQEELKKILIESINKELIS